jgi:hypothetical protein
MMIGASVTAANANIDILFRDRMIAAFVHKIVKTGRRRRIRKVHMHIRHR